MSDTEKVINWSNWTEYIDVDDKTKSRPTLDAFTKQTGIKVNYSEDYLDNDEFYAKVRPLLEGGKDTGRDVWCSTDWMVARLIRQGYVQKLDLANIPNAKNLDASLKNVEFDPGRLYSLPWQSGFAGIGYNLKATGGKKIETMTQLLTDPALKGKVTLLTEMRDTVGLVMMEQGKDISKFTDADFQAAIDMIQQAKDSGQIKGFTGNEYTDGLAKGDIAACVAWTGDVVQLQFADDKIQYALPEKGFTLWSDNFVIPALAKHKKNAEKLIDYYYDPAVMAQVAAWVNYIAPVKGTKEELVKIDPELGENPLIVPTPDVLARAQVFRGLTPGRGDEVLQDVRVDHRGLMVDTGKGDLSLVALTKSFGSFTAVQPLDLTIPQGSFFALLGPSGCGKTTTLRMIAGLEPPTGGRIRIGEQDITDTKAYQRNVNTVFQSYALFPHMTVLDNVMFGLSAAGTRTPSARPTRRSSSSSWPRWASKRPTQLSGGMQQRVALARALVNRPDVLLLDEPLGALDLKLRRQMQIELKRIQQEVGLTFIHVTHDQEEAMTMADSIAVMNAGRLEQLGDPATLYEQPQSTFVANFLGQSNLLRAKVVAGRRPTGSARAQPRHRPRGRRASTCPTGSPTSGSACARRSCASARAAAPTGCAAPCATCPSAASRRSTSSQMPWGRELTVVQQNDGSARAAPRRARHAVVGRGARLRPRRVAGRRGGSELVDDHG